MMSAEKILQIIANGVIGSKEAIFSLGPPSTLKAPGISPTMPFKMREKNMTGVQRVHVRGSKEIYYRLGNEFHSPESLLLISHEHPDLEVKAQAAKILQNIHR